MTNPQRRRSTTGLFVAAGIASLMLALGMSGTLGAFVASITNSNNTAATGTLTMQETNAAGTVTCTSDSAVTNVATCATINKYGGTAVPLIPGTPVTTTVKIKNTGTVPATAFTVDGKVCAQSDANGAAFSGTATDLCAKTNVVIKSGTKTVFSGTAAAFDSGAGVDLLTGLGVTSIAPTVETTFDITVTLDSTATSAYQGLQVSQPIEWAFQA